MKVGSGVLTFILELSSWVGCIQRKGKNAIQKAGMRISLTNIFIEAEIPGTETNGLFRRIEQNIGESAQAFSLIVCRSVGQVIERIEGSGRFVIVMRAAE